MERWLFIYRAAKTYRLLALYTNELHYLRTSQRLFKLALIVKQEEKLSFEYDLLKSV